MITLKQHEERLNQMYADIFTEEEAVEQFIHWTAKNRGKGNRTTEAHIRHCYINHMLGTLERRMDPIAFRVSRNEHF